MTHSSVIYGLEGLSVSADERAFFQDIKPYGYILFARNIDTPEQLLSLTDSLRELSGNSQLPILIDQEGGRVARMKPPHWPAFPSAKALLDRGGGDTETTQEIIYQNALRLGEALRHVGITVNCAPVADIPTVQSDPIIGDRAYGADPDQVSIYARAMADGLMAAGILPVLKHIPGHGRATVDSHISLPKVDEPLAVLEATDFKPFRALKDLPYAMTAHIIYSALDKGNCATLSAEVIRYIRDNIGYKGLLMSDDLSMQALSGDYAKRTAKALAAGCDLVLHCNGKMEEMTAIAQALTPVTDRIATLTKLAFQGATSKKVEMA